MKKGGKSWHWLAWRRPREDLTNTSKYLLEMSEEVRDRLLVVSSDRTRDNESKLKYRKFNLNKREKKKYCVIKYWNRLPRKFLESPSLQVFKTTGHSPKQPAVIALASLRGTWTTQSPTVLSKLSYSVVL